MTLCWQTALQLEALDISCHVGNDLPSWSVLEPLNPSHLQILCSVSLPASLKGTENWEFLCWYSHPDDLFSIWLRCSYHSHGAEQAAVAEENDGERDAEMKDKHIDDKWGVVDLRLGGVVVDPAGTLHSLWDVPASTHVIIIPPRPSHLVFDSTHVSWSVLRVNSKLSVQMFSIILGVCCNLKAWQSRSTCCNIQNHTGTIPAVVVLRTLKPWSMWVPARRWHVSHQNGSWSSVCRQRYSAQ